MRETRPWESVTSTVAVALTVTAVVVLGSCSRGGGAPSLRSAQLDPDGRTLELEFAVCNPSPFEAEVRETPSDVVLSLSVGDGTAEDCAAVMRVVLDQPLADRPLIVDGGEIDVQRLGTD